MMAALKTRMILVNPIRRPFLRLLLRTLIQVPMTLIMTGLQKMRVIAMTKKVRSIRGPMKSVAMELIRTATAKI